MKRALLLLLASCGPDWDATHAAAARRIGGARVESCLRIRGCVYKQECLDEVERTYCVPEGEPGCSRNEQESLCS